MKKYLALFFLVIMQFASAAPIKSIHFATEATYPPFEYVNTSGQIKGFDIAIAKALCEKLQAQCTFSNQPWDSLIPSLKIGKFDALIAAIGITDERAKQVDFTNPYYVPSVSFVGVANQRLILSAAGLKGKTVGVQGGTTFEYYLRKEFGNAIKINTYPSEQDAFLDLVNGRVDLVVGDTPIMQQWLKTNKNHKFAMIGKPIINAKYFGIGDGIAVQKGNTQLVNALNKALAQIKADGTYDKIVNKYFGN